MICDRPKCRRQAPADDLYCSERCFEQDHDPTPITVRKQGGVSVFTRCTREPVILPDNPAYWRRLGRASDIRREC